MNLAPDMLSVDKHITN